MVDIYLEERDHVVYSNTGMSLSKQSKDENVLDRSAAEVRIRESSHKQAAMLEKVSGNLDSLASEVAEDTKSAEKGVQLVGNVSVLCSDGNSAIEELRESLALLNSLEQRLAEVENRMAQVQKECLAIDDIAAQSHLLAVNATIEAAHLGDDGASFRVVANSIREMAQSSRSAAEVIHRIISEGTNDINSVRTVAKDVSIANAVSGQKCLAVFAEISSGVEHIQRSMNDSMVIARKHEKDTREMSSGLRQHAEDNSRTSCEIIGLITGNSIIDVSPAECHSAMHRYNIIDVRRTNEFNDELGHIANAQLLTIDDAFALNLARLNKDQAYLFT